MRELGRHASGGLLVGLIGVALVGSALRLRQLGSQIIGDDEWHGVAIAAHESFAEIFTQFRAADASIPLTLFYKLLLETVGLSEFGLHALQLTVGIAAIVILPLLVRAMVGHRTAFLFACALATSPLLVYYSRYARPYVLAACFGFGSIAAFALWLRERRLGYASAYVLLAVSSGWLSPPSLPAALAPPFFYLVVALGGRSDVGGEARLPTPASIASLLVLTGLGIALWLLPAVGSLGAIAEKAGKGGLEAPTAWLFLELFSGSAVDPVVALVLALAGLGGFAIHRRQPLLFRVLAVAVLTQYTALLLLRPHRLQIAIVVARYSIICLPIVLLAVAMGLHVAMEKIEARLSRRVAWGFAAAVFLGWFFAGPIPKILGPVNSLAHHDDFQYDYDHGGIALPRAALGSIPAFYRHLSELPGSRPVIEFPHVLWWSATIYHRYQQLHHQPVLVGYEKSSVILGYRVRHLGLKLRNHVNLEAVEEIEASGARCLVIHKDLANEFLFLEHLGRDPDASSFRPPRPGEHVFDRRFGPRSRQLAHRMIAFYRERSGEPVYLDRWIAVFALGDRGDCGSESPAAG